MITPTVISNSIKGPRNPLDQPLYTLQKIKQNIYNPKGSTELEQYREQSDIQNNVNGLRSQEQSKDEEIDYPNNQETNIYSQNDEESQDNGCEEVSSDSQIQDNYLNSEPVEKEIYLDHAKNSIDLHKSAKLSTNKNKKQKKTSNPIESANVKNQKRYIFNNDFKLDEEGNQNQVTEVKTHLSGYSCSNVVESEYMTFKRNINENGSQTDAEFIEEEFQGRDLNDKVKDMSSLQKNQLKTYFSPDCFRKRFKSLSYKEQMLHLNGNVQESYSQAKSPSLGSANALHHTNSLKTILKKDKNALHHSDSNGNSMDMTVFPHERKGSKVQFKSEREVLSYEEDYSEKKLNNLYDDILFFSEGDDDDESLSFQIRSPQPKQSRFNVNNNIQECQKKKEDLINNSKNSLKQDHIRNGGSGHQMPAKIKISVLEKANESQRELQVNSSLINSFSYAVRESDIAPISSSPQNFIINEEEEESISKSDNHNIKDSQLDNHDNSLGNPLSNIPKLKEQNKKIIKKTDKMHMQYQDNQQKNNPQEIGYEDDQHLQAIMDRIQIIPSSVTITSAPKITNRTPGKIKKKSNSSCNFFSLLWH